MARTTKHNEGPSTTADLSIYLSIYLAQPPDVRRQYPPTPS